MSQHSQPNRDLADEAAAKERMTRIGSYLSFVDEAIARFTLPESPARLYDPARYILQRGGKRIRPVLVIMGCELFNADFSKAKNGAIAIELFHNFTLIHDDIMDKAPLRRGEPTVHSKWNANIAILSGDALLIEAYKLICTYPPELSQKLLRLFNTTATEVCEGQQIDMDFETDNAVSIEKYLEMIRLKTAVLLGCSLKMGALIGGSGEQDAQDLYDFGVNLGLAFQLQDDILDVYGNQQKFGKQVGGDILSNKKTYLSLRARMDADSEQQKLLHSLSNENNAVKKVNDVIAVYNQLGIEAKAQQQMHTLFSLAMAKLDAVGLPDERKRSLVHLADFLMKREF